MAERTRVVFIQGQREASLTLVNLNAYPVITQVWVDDGRLDGEPVTALAPFMPLPPVFRLEPHQQRSLRLLSTGQPQPEDRESLYWLNIYEIPPRPSAPQQAADALLLTVTMRTQMKLFYRPRGLQPSAEEAARHLAFTLEKSRLRLDNPTPYHITLTGLVLQVDAQQLSLQAMLLRPFSVQTQKLDQPLPEGQPASLEFEWIDDDGARHQSRADLKPPPGSLE